MMHEDIAEVLLTREQIARRVQELGSRISRDYEGKELVTVCILKGAAIFYADLLRNIDIPVVMDFMVLRSYGNSRQSSGIVQISMDMAESITGKHVLIVEDILDSGQTLDHLSKVLRTREPASLKIACLLNKPTRRLTEVEADYCGFEIPDKFVVGYGLDFAERYRNLEYVGALKSGLYD